MANTYTNLLYHIVYSTKYRSGTMGVEWRPEPYKYMGGLINERDGIGIEIGGMSDHIHILAKLSPKFAIMDVLRDIKALSSKWINDRKLTPSRFEWQTGYGAFSVNQSNVAEVREYIRNQEHHHRQMSFKTEYIEFLKRNHIEFEMKYVFDEEHIA